MGKTNLLSVVAQIVLLTFIFNAPALTCTHSGDCGAVPAKPAPPAGCKDLTPRCVCDENGDDCHWEWICVPN